MKEMLEPIPAFKAELPSHEHILKYLKEIDSNRWYSNFGPLVKNLHQRLADYFGVDTSNLITLANATLALEGAFQTAATKSPEWQTPSWTFAATNLAALRANVEFRFQDIDDSWGIVPGENQSNLVEVLPFGARFDSRRIDYNNFDYVIIDAAASFYSMRKFDISTIKSKIGIIFSFHPTKSMPGAEGGVFVSNDPDWVEKVRVWSNFGFDGSRNSTIIATNAKMSEYAAAVLHSSLDSMDDNEKLFRENMSWALEISKKFNLRTLASLEYGDVSPYWIVKSEREVIKVIEANFKIQKIETRRWWEYGCHKMPVFIGVPHSSLEKTELAAETSLGLPFAKSLSENEKTRIESALNQILESGT